MSNFKLNFSVFEDSLFTSIDSLILVFDQNRVYYFNQAFQKFSGYSTDEIENKVDIIKLLLPKCNPDDVSFLSEIQQKKSIQYCNLLLSKSGQKIPVTWSMTVFETDLNSDGFVVVAIGIDLSQQQHNFSEQLKRKEEELIATQNETARYQTIFEASPFSIFVIRDGIVVFMNESTLDMLGLNTAQEFLGQPILEFISPDSKDIVEQRLQIAQTEGHLNTSMEVEMLKKDGSILFAKSISAPIIFENKPSALVMVRDITNDRLAEQELKLREDKLKSVFKASPVGIALVVNRVLIEVNEKLCEMTGYNSDELLGKSTRMLYFTEQEFLSVGKEKYDEIKKYGIGAAETLWKKKNGEPLNILLSSSPLARDDFSKGVIFIAMDITASKNAERELKASAQHIRAIYSSMTEGFCLHEVVYNDIGKPVDYKILEINYAYEFITGLKRKDILGKCASQIYGTGFPPFLDVYSQVAESGVPASFEIYFEPMKKYLFISACSPQKGQFATLFLDITERKKIEEQLKQSEEKYRSIFNGTNEAIIIHDYETVAVLDVNEAALEMFGFNREKLLTLTMQDVSLGESPYSQKEALEWIEKTKKEGPQLFEWLSKKNTGELFWCEILLKMVLVGKHKRIMTIIRDISRRKKDQDKIFEYERKYRQLMDQSFDGIASCDLEGKILECNQAFCHMIGYSREEILQMNFAQITPQQWLNYEFNILENKVYRQGYSGLYEKEYIHKNGTIFPVEISSFIMKDAQGCNTGTWAIVRDISERKKVQDLIQKEKEVAQRYLDIAGVIFIVIGHDQKVQLVNQKGCEALESSEENIVGLNWFDHFIPVMQRETIRAYFEKIISGQISDYKLVESPILTTNKEIRLITWTNTLLKDDNGAIIGTLSSGEDVTEKRRVEEELKNIFNLSLDMVCIQDIHAYKFIKINPAFTSILGYTYEELSRLSFMDLVHPDDKNATQEMIEKRLKKGQTLFNFVNRYLCKNGSYKWIEWNTHPFSDKEIAYSVGRDITERMADADNLKKLSMAVEQNPSLVMITDTKGVIEYVNRKFVEVTGYSFSELVGKTPNQLKSGHTSKSEYENLWKTILSGNQWYGEFCNKKKNGELFWEIASISPMKNDKEEITHFVAVFEDITKHKEYERILEYQANYDSLTNLPNRFLANDRLRQAIVRSQRNKNMVALMFVDLDQFKLINDSMGHALGDEMLVETARRLQLTIRESDTVARLGGDEFLVILSDLNQIEQAEKVAHKILNSFSEPFILEGQEVFVSASVGISIYPIDGAEPFGLLKNADAAMYKAKEDSRNTIRFFQKDMNERAVERMEMESLLRRALERKEFVLNYQPILNITTGQIVGVEALLRWQSKERGLIGPTQFIPLAEETGLIIPIGNWVIQEACSTVRQLQKKLNYPLKLSVNFSTRQFKGLNLINEVDLILKETEFNSKELEIEITESLLVEEALTTQKIIQELLNRGIVFSIDDFGTGYSALNYLRQYNFNGLKIDRSFVKDIGVREETSSLIKAIISMAHSLRMIVVAEGVETEEQLNYLRFQGCDLAQGFYFSRPLPKNELLSFLKEHLKSKKR